MGNYRYFSTQKIELLIPKNIKKNDRIIKTLSFLYIIHIVSDKWRNGRLSNPNFKNLYFSTRRTALYQKF